MITAAPGLRTARAICRCDHPGCAEVVDIACPLESLRFDKGHVHDGTRLPDRAKANKRLTSIGWRVARDKILCPTHAKPEKPIKEFGKMNTIIDTPPPKADSQNHGDLRQPNREQKRSIIEMLGACYDTKAQRYTGDETDISVAKAIGNGILFGWVADIREEFFGPIGSNAAMDDLQADIHAAIAKSLETAKALDAIAIQAKKLCDDLQRRSDRVMQDIADMNALRTRLDRIREKLGPKA